MVMVQCGVKVHGIYQPGDGYGEEVLHDHRATRHCSNMQEKDMQKCMVVVHTVRC